MHTLEVEDNETQVIMTSHDEIIINVIPRVKTINL